MWLTKIEKKTERGGDLLKHCKQTEIVQMTIGRLSSETDVPRVSYNRQQ